MKRDFRLQSPDFKLVAVVLCVWLVALAAGAVTANPYEAIVGRNVFGLKPPTLVAPPPAAAPAAATTIKLLGISTILDRRQVMLKVQTAARPPEPAKEKSYLWTEGQGEDNIEVLEIDAVAGAVKIKNQDATLSLTMKDDAEKPAVGAALPGPAVANPLVVPHPGIPAPTTGVVPPANPGGASAMGGSGSGRTIPTRSLRTSAPGSGMLGAGAAIGSPTANLSPQQEMAVQRTPEETAILYEVNRAKNEQLRQSGIPIPALPQHPFFKGAQ